MRKFISIVFIIIPLLITFGCNVIPKSVQYQKEEEKLVGSTDIINPVVEEIQVILAGLGYDTGNTDGVIGQKTRDAIKEFQESVGLKSTGYMDKLTLTQLEDMGRAYEEQELKKVYNIEVKNAYRNKEADSPKEFAPTTRDIQAALKNAGFDPGSMDGKMGPVTRQAIKEFQRTKGLTPDGKVGPNTWVELSKHLKK
jgi:peptidoglycan hydrolase-like protein with peptidoglycan-binding domain